MAPAPADVDALPVVLLPVGPDDAALDATLAALDAGTPAGTRAWLADDARAGPRSRAIIERWLRATPLCADYSRREAPVGEAAHLHEALRACGGADVAVLAPDALPAPGWLQQLAACLARDPAIATATPWSNAGEGMAWPRAGEVGPVPSPPGLAALGRAAAAMPARHPELPAALPHAVLLRGTARIRVGGTDADSFGSWYGALADLSLRLAAQGWRNVLCEGAYVACPGEGVPAGGDLEALAARWPAWPARLARFLMDDPLRAARDELSRRLAALPEGMAQPDLFDAADPSPAERGVA